jgi:Fe-S oxidoreductase
MTKQDWMKSEKNLIKDLKDPFLKNIERRNKTIVLTGCPFCNSDIKFLESKNGEISVICKNTNDIMQIIDRKEKLCSQS